MLPKEVGLLAGHFWRVRGCPEGDSLTDWRQAEWLLGRFRPYLALRAALDPAALAAEIAGRTRASGRAGDATTVIAVLDGAPEHSWARRQEVHCNCSEGDLAAEHRTEHKDRLFYRVSRDAFCLYGARIVAEDAASAEGPDGAEPAARRSYQDACLAEFSGQEHLADGRLGSGASPADPQDAQRGMGTFLD